jgi:hypothetical protein
MIKKLLGVAGLAALAVVGWSWHREGRLAAWMDRSTQPPAIRFDRGDPGGSSVGTSDRARGSSAIHKCQVGSSVIYTDAPCERPGSERPLQGGSVTVLKGQRPSAPASAQASGTGVPNARDLLLDRGEPTLMQRQIERATNP